MSFPQTRHSLIRRLTLDRSERDWQMFLQDYWGPVYRFALRHPDLTHEDAEDVAAQTFEALLQNDLLGRWVSDRSAKLRTLLCSVVRYILSNRRRVRQGRDRLMRRHAKDLAARDDIPSIRSIEASAEQVDAFYAAWVEEIVGQAVESLLEEYHRQGKGDYFRVLHGRLCEGMSMPQVSRALGISVASVENYFRATRKRLAQRLEEQVRLHVGRYSPDGEAEDEFAAEWGQLGAYLKEHGGLEQAVRRSYERLDPVDFKERQTLSTIRLVKRMTEGLNGPLRS